LDQVKEVSGVFVEVEFGFESFDFLGKGFKCFVVWGWGWGCGVLDCGQKLDLGF